MVRGGGSGGAHVRQQHSSGAAHVMWCGAGVVWSSDDESRVYTGWFRLGGSRARARVSAACGRAFALEVRTV